MVRVTGGVVMVVSPGLVALVVVGWRVRETSRGTRRYTPRR